MKARVLIRKPEPGDCRALLAAVRRSRSLHRSWVAPPDTPKSYSIYLKRIHSPDHRGFLIIHRQTSGLVGVININSIVFGNFRSGYLGYYAFADQAGQGLMKEGMRQVLGYAFKQLKLHRLEANIQPQNRRSVALVRTCGFVREGYSKRYLKIAGRWRDHERWALLAEDF